MSLVIWLFMRNRTSNQEWNSGPPAGLLPPPSYDSIRALDPDFSGTVFEDFAFRLFATAQRARANPEALAAVAPYVAQKARDQLAQRNPVGVPVQQVVVGSLHAVNILVPDDPATGRINIRVEIEANVATAEHTYYSVEVWLFARDAARHSKPPGAARTFPCPNCGAPWQAAAMGTQVCASCGQTVDNGRFDWTVMDISLISSDERPPTVTKDVPEQGTDLPTIVADSVYENANELAQEPVVARLHAIYGGLNTAWSNNDLAPARPFVSDALYDYLQYWIDTYKRQNLRNELVDMRITQTELANVVRDKYYDAITFRVWGTGKDYVIHTDTGRVLRGSKHTERPYSEYWTLIRSAGTQKAPQPSATCNNCGAPLQINMAGNCEHCGAHVTSGEFDWVLSKIEQDDSYGG